MDNCAEGKVFIYSLLAGGRMGNKPNLRGSKGHEVRMTLGHFLLYINVRLYSILKIMLCTFYIVQGVESQSRAHTRNQTQPEATSTWTH
jgi:hypothetical protein